MCTSTPDRAAALARRVLAILRELEETIFGTTYDPVGDAASNVLKSAFGRTGSREAMCGLLDLAINDDRPRHSHPDHPMRVIQEFTQYLDPDVGPLSEHRDRILKAALDWFDEDPGEDRWRLLAEESQHVFDPHVEGAWMDPGSRREFTIARGIETAEAMSRLVSLWDEIDSRVRGAAGAALSHAAASHLCDVFRVWSSLVTDGAAHRVETSDTHHATAYEGAQRVLGTLAYLAERFPAVPIRVNRQLALVTLWNTGPTWLEDLPVHDDRIARFVGVREPDDDVEEWMAQRHREHDSLAGELVALGAEEGVAEFQRLLTEVQVLDGHHGGDALASLLAEHSADPQNWLRAAVARGIPSMVGPMLSKARVNRVEVDDMVHEGLQRPKLRGVVLRAFVNEADALDRLAEAVLANLREGDAMFIGDLWTAETATPMLRSLLVHPLGEVRAVAAVAFGEGVRHGPSLPEDLRAEWRTALLEANPDELPQHSRWRLNQILEHAVETDPELSADWFIANAEMPGKSYGIRPSFQRRSDLLRSLPPEQKRRVCEALPAGTLISSGFASDLLGSDSELAAELLAEGVVNVQLLLRSLSGYRDHTVEGLSPVLVAAGVDPEVIAARTLSARETVGSVAQSIRGDLAFFAELAERRPELREVSEAAAARLQVELDEAVAEERMERLNGW